MREKIFFFTCFRTSSKRFSDFWQKCLAAFSEMHSMCAEEHFEGKVYPFKKSIYNCFRTSSGRAGTFENKLSLIVKTLHYMSRVNFCGKHFVSINFFVRQRFRILGIFFQISWQNVVSAGLSKLQSICSE